MRPLLAVGLKLVDEVSGALRVGKSLAQTARARKTIERGKPERLLWTDETARAAICDRSKFLGP